MAKITFKAGERYAVNLARLGGRSGEIAKRALHEAAGILADRIRANLEANLNDPAYVGKRDNILFKNTRNAPTGDLLEHYGISPITRESSGWWTVKVGVEGYDSRGVPNALKARVMESGSSTIRKRPFVRPAVDAAKKQALAAMGQVIDEECEKIMKGS